MLYAALADFRVQHLAVASWLTAYTCLAEHVRHGMCSWAGCAEVLALVRFKEPQVNDRVGQPAVALREARLRIKGMQTPLHSPKD